MDEQLFELRFCVKQLERHSKKADKEARSQEVKLKACLARGDVESGRIYAENVVRKRHESVNYLRLASKVDATVGRIKSAQTLTGIAKTMAGVTKALEKAISSADLERATEIMDQFEVRSMDVDVATSTLESTMSPTTAITPSAQPNYAQESEVDALMRQMLAAHAVGGEAAVAEQIAAAPDITSLATPSSTSTVARRSEVEDEDALTQRLKALRE